MLATLKARLKELVGEIKNLTDKTEMTADDFAALETKNTEVDDVEKKIDALTKAEASRARSALPANDPVITEERKTPALPERKLVASEKVGLMVAAMAKAHLEEGGRGPKATFKCLEDNGFGFVAKEFALEQRALNSGSGSAGGVLVPENMSSEIIDILRPRTTFLQGNPRRVPMIGGNYKQPAAATGATAGWRGEGQAATVTQGTFKEINLTSKFLDAIVPVTNQLIRFSLPDVKAWVEMDLAREMAKKIDYAAYFGAGTIHTPLGITKISGITRNAATGGTTPTVAQVEADASLAERGMMGADLDMMTAQWVMSPRTFIFLQNMRDGNGNRYFPELQLAEPKWRNKKVLLTTQISETGGVGTNETEILLVAFGHVLFGEGAGIEFSVSTDASYVVSGTTTSAFQNRLTLISASAEADFDMNYLEAVSVIETCTWGA